MEGTVASSLHLWPHNDVRDTCQQPAVHCKSQTGKAHSNLLCRHGAGRPWSWEGVDQPAKNKDVTGLTACDLERQPLAVLREPL